MSTVEIVAGYVTAWLSQTSSGLGDRLSETMSSATEEALRNFVDKVRGRISLRRAGSRAISELQDNPGDPGGRALMEDVIADEFERDPDLLREWEADVACLQAMPELRVLLRGVAQSDTVRGRQAGLVATEVPDQALMEGVSLAHVVERGGESIGLVFKPPKSHEPDSHVDTLPELE